MVSLNSPNNNQVSDIYLFCKMQIALMAANEALISIAIEYSDFANVFFPELVFEYLKYIKINYHTIKLIDKQQIFYELIFYLEPIKLKILKTYIKTNLANSFIRLFKSSIEALIFFDKKIDKSF